MISHANLLILNQAANQIAYLKEQLIEVIKTKTNNDLDLYINKINNDQYLDLVILDGASLKKQDLIDLQNRFNNPGLESIDVKFYLIKNIEQASKIVLNSLLKFVEEPPSNTFAFFSCKDVNKVLLTLRSRCNLIQLKADYETFNKYLNQLEVYNTYNLDLKTIFTNLEDLDELINSSSIKVIFDCFNVFVNNTNLLDQLKFVDIIKDFSALMINYLISLLLSLDLSIKQKEALLNLANKNNKALINKNVFFTLLWNIMNWRK
ncbi:hypothetical protein [Ureaplasma diversum]|uniref:DNA polymerase III subunit n=1 Tax=Ureaplasma diversum NCTC 246 TaxID=1188241 RepID=A0A084EYE6_9BACT|nr:hypothetical protein [Ureaplasma diversum]KEZ22988.1 DNA polymerase III subunit [Ureaplasma diversum NCTC 246]